MDKLTLYSKIIRTILSEYCNYQLNDSLKIEKIFDESNGHYQIILLGWDLEKYVHDCLIHLDLKEDKIWIQWNMTELDIAKELVNLGVEQKDIVIGFHPPSMRQLTDYAVG
jgi:hypothetical protein